jgi:y4mF family transcriptional regulator
VRGDVARGGRGLPLKELSPYEDRHLLSPNGDTAMMSPNDDRVSVRGSTVRPIQTSRAFGSAVRRARKDQGLSQADLAARAGVGRPWLSELETGKRTAELGRALSVLSALGLALTFVDVPGPDGSTVDLGQIIDGRT